MINPPLVVAQPLGQNNAIAGIVHILPRIFLECTKKQHVAN